MNDKYEGTSQQWIGNAGELAYYLVRERQDVPKDKFVWYKNEDGQVKYQNWQGADFCDCGYFVDVKFSKSISDHEGKVNIEYEKWLVDSPQWFLKKGALGAFFKKKDLEGVLHFCHNSFFDPEYKAQVLAYGDYLQWKFYIMLVQDVRNYCMAHPEVNKWEKYSKDKNENWSYSLYFNPTIDELKQAGIVKREVIIPEDIIEKI